MKEVVSIENLLHFYGEGELKKQVLYDINLKLYQGEIVIMKGPSGSGKTTLLTLIGALRSAQQGSLKVNSQELVNANNSQLVALRRNIGYIFQSHNLLESLTARENVQMSMELHKDINTKQAKERAEHMLELVGLAERINYYPRQLSGGQKQRVAIARALVSHPKLVLADEPTAALDSKSGRSVVELMQKLAKEQDCTILLVTHDDRILDVAERMVTMEDGRLVVQNALFRASIP
jgi:putative ABC transport system ATP-binding protein